MIPRGSRERTRVGRGLARERDRLGEEPGVFGGGEPLSFVTRSRANKKCENVAIRLGRVLLPDRSERGEVRARTIRIGGVALERLVDLPRGKEDSARRDPTLARLGPPLLAELVDPLISVSGASAAGPPVASARSLSSSAGSKPVEASSWPWTFRPARTAASIASSHVASAATRLSATARRCASSAPDAGSLSPVSSWGASEVEFQSFLKTS